MATREAETVEWLRGDEPLEELVPGGIYADADLSVEGITESAGMPDVWAGGEFQTTIVVRERAPVPTGDLQDTYTQHTSQSQAVGVWVYAKSAETIQTVLEHVYRRMMGKRFAKAFSATWAGGAPLMQAPELPAGIFTRHEDYRIVSIRMPVVVED